MIPRRLGVFVGALSLRLTLRALFIQSAVLSLLILALVVASRYFSWGFPLRRAVNPLYAVLKPEAPNMFSVAAVAVFALFFFSLWHLFGRGRRQHLWVVLLFFAVSSLAINLSVAMVRGGPSALEAPFQRTEDYYAETGKVEGFLPFLRDYPAILATMETHGHVHPPGPVLFLWAVSQWIGPGPLIGALAVIVIGSFSVAPAYLLFRDLYGEKTAAIGGALYVMAPSIIMFTATSMNAVFSFLAAWAFYLCVRVVRGGIRVRRCLAVGGLLSLSTFFTFDQVFVVLFVGTAILTYVALTGNWRRLPAAFLIPAVVIVAYVLLYVSTGYNVIQTFILTYGYYQQDVAEMIDLYGAQSEDALYWFFGNPAAFLAFLGAPTVVLLLRGIVEAVKAWSRDAIVSSVALASLAALLAANVLGLYRGEVERIWTYLVPLAIVLALRAFPKNGQSRSIVGIVCAVLGLLAAQTLLFEHVLYTYW